MEQLKERDIVLAIEVPISDELNYKLKEAIRSIAQMRILPEYFTVLNADEC